MKRMFINLLVYLLISSYQLKSQTLYSVDKWMEVSYNHKHRNLTGQKLL